MSLMLERAPVSVVEFCAIRSPNLPPAPYMSLKALIMTCDDTWPFSTAACSSFTERPVASASICQAPMPASVNWFISWKLTLPRLAIWARASEMRLNVSVEPPMAAVALPIPCQQRDDFPRRKPHRQQALRGGHQLLELERRGLGKVPELLEEEIGLLGRAHHRFEPYLRPLEHAVHAHGGGADEAHRIPNRPHARVDRREAAGDADPLLERVTKAADRLRDVLERCRGRGGLPRDPPLQTFPEAAERLRDLLKRRLRGAGLGRDHDLEAG
jgi:hypothetical protein